MLVSCLVSLLNAPSPTVYAPLLEDIVRQTGAAVVFPYYTPAPEKQYPYQFNETYAILEHVVGNDAKYNLQTDSLVLAGDSVGGNARSFVCTSIQTLIIEQDISSSF